MRDEVANVQWVEGLERSLRRSRWMSLGAGALAACAILVAVRPWLLGEMRTTKLTLVNTKGETVGTLSVDETGEPRLALRLERAKGTVVLGSLGEDIGGFGFVGDKGSISLAADSDGLPALSVRSAKRNASLSIARGGEPTLMIVSDEGNLSATASTLRFRQHGADVLVLPDAPKR
jgi:hypothetical protein